MGGNFSSEHKLHDSVRVYDVYAVSRELSKQGEKLASLTTSVTGIEKNLDKLEKRIEGLEEKIDNFKSGFTQELIKLLREDKENELEMAKLSTQSKLSGGKLALEGLKYVLAFVAGLLGAKYTG